MFLDFLENTLTFKKLFNENYNVIKKANDEGICLFLLSYFRKSEKSIFIILPNLYIAQKYYDILSERLKDDVLFFPADELIINEMLISSDEFKFERLETIKASFENKKKIIVTHTSGIIRKLFNKKAYKNSVLHFHKNETYDIGLINQKFQELGYKRVYTVKKYGEYSIKGEIVDFYTFYDEPIRLDFFDDLLETIKTFNIETQLSFKNLDEAIVYPNTEMIYSNDECFKALEKIKNFISNLKEDTSRYTLDIDNLTNRNSLNILNRYINFFDKDKSSILDFFNADLFLVDLNRMEEIYNKNIMDLNEYCESNSCYSLFDLNYFYELKSLFFKREYKVFEGLTYYEKGPSLTYFCRNISQYENNIRLFVEDCVKRYLDMYVILSITDLSKISLLEDYFKKYDIRMVFKDDCSFEKGIINLTKEKLLPVEIIDESLFIVTWENIFKQNISYKTRYRSLKQEGAKISSIDDLKVGDYVVHFDHGIGRYMGIKTMKSLDVIRDYIYLVYADDNALYIPIEQFFRLKKYVGSENSIPKLTKLGTKQWENTKRKVKEKINDISIKLIDLYAKREAALGFVYKKDDEEQALFDNGFEYEETPDQLKIIEEVKKDMESTKPMDRLICGDVGYGKTEIALRAAFKAVMNNKQVAYLAPTTVLARQHFNTFIKRFKSFGAEIKLLTRFCSSKEEKEIIKGLKSGIIDIVIGTHKILSNDIIFKDLGLFIIDEEQRFGVKHKERIKEMKINVDTITLTATPIPRTLQMSILGIKDLSMLETPPKNRYPVQTYVLERNDTIIKEAIERELARKGQVFYLYNKVNDIIEEAEKLKILVPEARVCYAHGKMDKNMLDEIIESFTNHEYDLLVATTIIETGIDIPNTNTLIIHDSDMLGLSQLYQLRGRVGRSDKIAYAYLMFEKNKRISENAYKRLEAIKEFTELGSGFKIALRDLNIRGAGDILGSDQSGFIDTVGLDLYLKILDDSIKEKQGKKIIEEGKKEIGKVLYNRHISEDLIANDDVRIAMHKKIDEITKEKQIDDLINEFKDRFGKIDDDIIKYMEEKYFKNNLNLLSVNKVLYTSFEAIIYLPKEITNSIGTNDLFLVANEISRNINFEYRDNSFLVKFHTIRSSNWVLEAGRFLEKIVRLVHKKAIST